MPIVGSVLGALKRKKVRLQLSISMLFMILILPVLALIMFYSYRENSRNLISLANVQIERARDDSIAVATNLLEPVSGTLRMIAEIAAFQSDLLPHRAEPRSALSGLDLGGSNRRDIYQLRGWLSSSCHPEWTPTGGAAIGASPPPSTGIPAISTRSQGHPSDSVIGPSSKPGRRRSSSTTMPPTLISEVYSTTRQPNELARLRLPIR